MRSFPAGVTDKDGQRGFVLAGGNDVTALDLATGSVLWRRPGIGLPVAATRSRLITFGLIGQELGLHLLDAETGRELAHTTDLGFPSWARDLVGQPDAMQFGAAEENGGIRLSWTLRQLYCGGAPPGEAIESQQAGSVTSGSILLDPETGTILERDPGGQKVREPLKADPVPSDDPNVLAQERIGDRLYALRVEPSSERGAELKVQARSSSSDQVEWEAPVGQIPDPQVRPLRE